METILSMIAKLIETVANVGAGAASSGLGYEPEVPEQLKQKEND